jgi:hypothetical protein
MQYRSSSSNKDDPRLALIRLAKQYGRHALHSRKAQRR